MVSRRLKFVALVLATTSISGGWIATGFAADAAAPLAVPPRPMGLDAPVDQIPNDARALVIVDSRLYKLIAPDLLAYTRAAAARRKFPWMDEGWQSPEIFLAHMRQSRRRFVWWNVHSNSEVSLISSEQANGMSNGGLIALLNGCAVGGFRQPGSHSHVDLRTAPENNMLLSLVYGRSAFLAALGTPHNRVNDEAATPLFAHIYSNGYLGMAHRLRLSQQDKDSPNPGALRGRQEMLIGDPFLDAR